MKRNLFVFFTAALTFVSVAISCKKIDTTTIGDDLIPVVDNVTTFDTVMNVITDNFLLEDSSRLFYSEPHAWGVIENDPEFGKTKGEVYFSLTPFGYSAHPFPKKDSVLVVDSVVLALAYSSTYGDSNSVQRMTVHEIDFDALFKDSAVGYPINTPFVAYSPTILGSKLIDFKTLDDSVYVRRKTDTLRLKNQLRIRLDNALFNRFLAYDTAAGSAYDNDTLFRAAFPGLALRVDEGGSPNKSALAYFSLNSDNTRLIFYYHQMSGSNVVDTLSAEFGFYNRANANLIKRTPANDYLAYLNNGNNNDDKMYIQSSPGSYATIRIPNLGTLSNRVIHRAELIVESLSVNPTEIFRKPTSLFLDAEDTANKRIITIPYDFSYQNDFTALFGGNIKNNIYYFNLSRYVQSIVTRHEPQYTLRLSAPFRTNAGELRGGSILVPSTPEEKSGYPINSPIAAGRVVLTGGAYPDLSKRVRLRIIYSKI